MVMKSARMALVLFEIQFTVKCFVCKAFLLRILDIMPVEWIFHIIFQRFIISVHVWERNQPARMRQRHRSGSFRNMMEEDF